MTQVTQLIIRPSQDQTRNLVRAIIDITKKQPPSHEALLHIRTLAAEALDMMADPKAKSSRPTVGAMEAPNEQANR